MTIKLKTIICLAALLALPLAMRAVTLCPTWTVNGEASVNGGKVILTTANGGAAGSAFSSSAGLDLSQNFSLTYQVYFGNTAAGGSGLAFVMQNSGPTVLGGTGSNLGFFTAACATPAAPASLAVEIRTNDCASASINGNLAVDQNGATVAGPVSADSGGANIKDGSEHALQLDWNASSKTLQARFDGSLRATYTADIVATVFGGNPQVYFGFTGGTGGVGNLQYFYDNNCVVPPSVCSTGWKMIGPAAILSNSPDTVIQLTTNTAFLVAAAWAPACINLAQDFDLQFKVNLGSSDGDGIAFVLQNMGLTALGTNGGGLGIAGLSPMVAIELDTYNNGGGCEMQDHIAVDTNPGAGCVAGPVQASPFVANITDGAMHDFEVKWNAGLKTFTIYFDGSQRLTYTNDVVTNVFSGTSCVYYGFTGSTGMYSSYQAFTDKNCVVTRTITPTFTQTPNWSATPTPTFTNTPNGCKVGPGSTISTYAGNGNCCDAGDGGPATDAQFNHPRGLAMDALGNLYVGATDDSVVRKINTAGIITKIAGTAGVGGTTGDGGPATDATMNFPYNLALDPAGNIYILDGGSFGGFMVRKVSPAGIISRVAGNGACCTYTGDGGQATAAGLNSPYGIALDSTGSFLYIADTANNAIRRVDLALGIILTVVGGNGGGYSGDGGPALAAKLNGPKAVWVDVAGDIFIGDSGNVRVRKVDAGTGNISTVAGAGGCNAGGDGGQATLASICEPQGLIGDPYGNLFISTSGQRVRMVNLGTGIISTLAGAGSSLGDGGPASASQVDNPWQMAFDTPGNLYIADSFHNRIRKIKSDCLATPTPTPAPPSPVSSSTPTPTASPSSSRTSTPTLTQTRTASPTATLTPVLSPTTSPTPVDTATPLPTATETPWPLILHLYGNSPNPFTGDGTYITYWLSRDAQVKIEIYTISGELTRTLDTFPAIAGDNEQFWNGRNSSGQQLASGVFVYFVKASADTGEASKAFGKCAVVR